jgi:hypothetical protein
MALCKMLFQLPVIGYTVRPSRSNAFCWVGVGRVSTMSGCSGVMTVTMVLRASYARSASNVLKLCTGRPRLAIPPSYA